MTGYESKILNDCDVMTIIERRIGEKNLTVTSWYLEPISNCSGFMGSYYRLNITVNRHGVVESYVFFAKTQPPPGPQQEFSIQNGVFNKEIVMYNEIVTRMGTGSGAKWLPECYFGKYDEIIVMENLTLSGYQTLDKYVPFGYEELACLFDTFARFHSRSLIFDEQLRHEGKNLYDIWGESLDERLVCNSELSMLLQKSSLDGSLALIDMVEGIDNNEKELLKRKFIKWSLNMVEALKPSKKYRNIICHRDVWSANFMFKLDEEGKSKDCRLIDFQFYTYIYPAMDLMLAMYMNSTRLIRDKYFNLLIKLYYNCLQKYLKCDANLNIDQVLPWETFLESCETARPTAMVYVINNQQITLISNESCEKYFSQSPKLLQYVLYGTGRTELVCPQFKTVPQYRERITENIFELYECLPNKLFNEYNDN